jgi:hypothetical protein
MTPLDLGERRSGSEEMCALLQQSLVWSPESHLLFPPPFRQGIRFCLFVYHNAPGALTSLPLELWLQILGCLPRSFQVAISSGCSKKSSIKSSLGSTMKSLKAKTRQAISLSMSSTHSHA